MNRLKLVALMVLAMYASAHAPAEEAADAPTVVFVCEHGSVKSLLAALLFERAAVRDGLSVHATARGTAPDENVPQWMSAELARDGFDIGNWRPTAVTSADVRSALRVVLFDVSLPNGLTTSADHWDGTPSVSKDYRFGRDAIASRVEALVAELKQQQKQSSD